jgi:hypothetical protein
VTTDAKRIGRDRFLAFICAYGIILSLVIRFSAAPLSRLLLSRYGIELPAYYPLIASFVALTLGSTMVGIVLGFVLLEARESRVLDMLAIGAAGMLFAGICTLALASFADNKVQAFAVMKMISGCSMLPLAAYFVDEPLQYAFGLFPPYWLVKAWWVAVEGGAWGVHLGVGIASNGLLLLWMARRFERTVHRSR